MRRFLPAAAALAAVLVPMPAVAAVPRPEVGPGIASAAPAPAASMIRDDQVVVRFSATADGRQRTALRAEAGAGLERRTRLSGGEVWSVPAGRAQQVADRLARRPGVISAAPTVVYRPAATTPNDPFFSEQWGLAGAAGIDADLAWPVSTGGPVTVAVVDTGLDYTHPDLAANIWSNPGEVANGADDDGNGLVDDLRGWDFFGNDAEVYPEPLPVPNPDPAYCTETGRSHGTHVAGTIGAVGNNGVGVTGVAWSVRLMGLDASGYIPGFGCGLPDYALADAILYARDEGAAVVNLSLGSGSYSWVLDAAVAASPGVLVVAAAGNSGTDNDVAPMYPCNLDYSHVICVSAATSAGGPAAFSNRGLSVDLAAPGQLILSTVLPTVTASRYAYYSGTSMAAPHVAGAAALLKTVAPALTPAQSRAALVTTVDADPSWLGRVASGGRLNLGAAVSQIRSPAWPAVTLQTAPGSRLGGADRYETAAQASAATFGSGVPVAYIATGRTFPDALAAGAVAGRLGAPVLLTNGGVLPTATGYELWRLAPRRIVVLGSAGVIPDSLLATLQNFTTGPVQRIGGSDRYATAAAVAVASFTAPVPVVYVATGTGFADALAGTPAAAVQGGPILLTSPTALPSATITALRALRPARIVVLGGTAAVSAAVAGQLAGYTTGPVQRLSGPDRYATAAAIADAVFPGALERLVLATGRDYPDALAGGPVAAVNAAPVLLADGGCVTDPIAAVQVRSGAQSVTALGAVAVLPDSAVAFTPC